MQQAAKALHKERFETEAHAMKLADGSATLTTLSCAGTLRSWFTRASQHSITCK
jgi:hypothetical protein